MPVDMMVDPTTETVTITSVRVATDQTLVVADRVEVRPAPSGCGYGASDAPKSSDQLPASGASSLDMSSTATPGAGRTR